MTVKLGMAECQGLMQSAVVFCSIIQISLYNYSLLFVINLGLSVKTKQRSFWEDNIRFVFRKV